MSVNRMFGVVLWSCPDEGRAVIWCEDHGKLAFYARSKCSVACADAHEGDALDAGDLIEFDVEDLSEQRRAHNPKLLVPDHAPCIATELRQGVGSGMPSDTLHERHAPATHNVQGEVVPLRPATTRYLDSVVG